MNQFQVGTHSFQYFIFNKLYFMLPLYVTAFGACHQISFDVIIGSLPLRAARPVVTKKGKSLLKKLCNGSKRQTV